MCAFFVIASSDDIRTVRFPQVSNGFGGPPMMKKLVGVDSVSNSSS
jgi:hypothetical protein